MRTVEIKVYSIQELQGHARETAIWTVADLERNRYAQNVDEDLAALLNCLPADDITADILRAAAEKVGSCYALDMVDDHIEDMPAVETFEQAKKALTEVATKMLNAAYADPYGVCVDEMGVLEAAEANDFEFYSDGQMYRG